MDMKRFAVELDDGSVWLVQTSIDIDEYLQKAHPDDLHRIVGHAEVQDGDLPTDRSFRDAWTFKGGKFGHDMPKARNIQRNRLRDQRREMLDALDVDYIRADEAGDAAEKARISTRKQVLRDVTAAPEIEAAETVDDLKALTIDVLAPA